MIHRESEAGTVRQPEGADGERLDNKGASAKQQVVEFQHAMCFTLPTLFFSPGHFQQDASPAVNVRDITADGPMNM